MIALVDRDGAWKEAGACVGVDPDLFFPVRGNADTQAKKVCLQCSVRLTCLEWALEHNETQGVWGGMSGRERRRLKARRRLEARAEPSTPRSSATVL